ncbi:MAG TPA: hypothetical protein VGP13_00630 [Candidatus Paceibacterota bacterium]|jgi:hypothetical protein|nr:hypothetical protein [Candidatus Paceibacterota bacterium]
MGLPILDPILTLHNAFGPAKKPSILSRSIVRWDDNPIIWIVFLGLGMSVEGARMFNLLPREGTSWVYIFPEALVNPDPHKALEIHTSNTERILADLEHIPTGAEVSILSISSGNAFGFYIANHYSAKHFISVVTGAGLGSEMFWSLACLPVARQARRLGYRSGAQYDKVLHGRLPIDNTEYLPKESRFYLGLADAQIPFWFGIKIYRRAKQHNPSAKFSLFMLGHVAVLYMVGQFLRTGIEPTIYGAGSSWARAQRWLAYTAVRVPFRDAPMLIGGLILGFDRLNRLLQKLHGVR